MIVVLAPSPALDVTYLLDRVELGEIHRPREVIRQAGGKGLNLARAAVTLGAETIAVAGLGGAIGALVRSLATRDGIRVSVAPTGAETRECVSAIPDEGAPTEFYEPAHELSDTEWAALDAAVADAGPGEGDWVVVAGRLPERALDRIGATLERARAAGARVAVDSSGPALAALLDRVRPELVKVNRAEAAEVLGRAGTAAELAVALQARTGAVAVVTDGAEGAVGADAAGAWRAHPDPLPGRFAIGSGDSFFAGLLAALGPGGSASAAGADLPAALLAASAAGSANTRRPGAGVFDRHEVDAAAARIRVERLPA